MNSSLASPAVQLAKAHSGHNEVVRSDSEINSHSADQRHWCSTFHGMNGCLAHRATIWCDTWWRERKGATSKLTKACQSKRLKSAPTSCPSEKIHGGGWAGCGKGASNHGREREVSNEHLILIVLTTVEWGGCLGKLWVNSSSIPICICILYLCLYLIVFVL